MKESHIKTIIFVTFSILLLCMSIFLIKKIYKTQNFGNNINSKNTDSIVNNILNMQSYEADVEIIIISNKTKNTYKMKQQYIQEDQCKQILQSPEKIKGTEIIFDNKSIVIKNTNLNLTKMFDGYRYLSDNALFLNTFIKEYNEENEAKQTTTENEIILEIKLKDEPNQYIKYKTLYIDKRTGNPTKMEVKDIAQKVRVYILYNEIKINGLQKI